MKFFASAPLDAPSVGRLCCIAFDRTSPEPPDPALQDETDSGVGTRRRKAVAAGWARLACLAGALGCTGPEPAADLDAPADPGTVPADLAASLEVVVEGDSVRLTLHLTNTTAAPITLRYPTAQRYDFVVRQGEAEVWRWSEGRMFAQVLTTDTIGAGETVSYREVWDAAGRGGVHTAEGRLLAAERPVHLETELEVG